MNSGIQRVFRGRESLKKLPQMMEKLGMEKPMIVGGETLTRRLMKQHPGLINAPVFSGYHPNPDLDDAAAGEALFRRQSCDGLISIGGGSAIDTAKAIRAALAAGRLEALKAQWITGTAKADGTSGEMEGTEVPQIAIPGTAGSGAEATPSAVVYVEGRKKSLSAPGLTPEGVILDASLLDSLPVYHKKASALDALCQGIESYWSRSATTDSRVNAYLAILGVLDNLKAYLAGDPHAAEEMMDAAYQSGKAIAISKTTAAHALSYQITTRMGLAHGHACMLTLPVIWEELNRQEDQKELMGELSSIMRLGNPLMGPKLLKGILLDLEMAIPEMPDAKTLEEMAGMVNTERLSNHPMALTTEDVQKIYRRSFLKTPPMEQQACMDIWRYYGA